MLQNPDYQMSTAGSAQTCINLSRETATADKFCVQASHKMTDAKKKFFRAFQVGKITLFPPVCILYSVTPSSIHFPEQFS